MPSWPSDLPPPFTGTVKTSTPKNIIRTSMEVGPAKVRRRTTADVAPLSFSMRLEESLLTVFDTFYLVTCASGALSFDYTHPISGDAVTARFVGEQGVQHISGDVYDVSVSLEVLP